MWCRWMLDKWAPFVLIVFSDMAVLVSLVPSEREILSKATPDEIVEKFAALAVSSERLYLA